MAIKLLLVSTLFVAGWTGPQAQAAPEPGGCTTVQAGFLGYVALRNCRYVATGPGQFTALTLNRWVISVSRDGSGFKTILAHAQRIVQLFPTDRGSAGLYYPRSGTIATLPGDIVDVSIYPDPYQQCRRQDDDYFCDPDKDEPPHSLPFAGYLEARDV